MEKIYDVTALGELLIDFTENGTSAQGNPLLEANPGGAPCNVLAMLEKLGKKTAFIGKVGKDMFGEQLKTAVEEVGIDTRNLVMDEEVHTTLAFVHTYPDGDRDFSFYRNPGADMMLKKEEVDEDLIRGAKIFHFGTLSSTHEGVREATRYAIDVAKEAGCIVSFDPNLRFPLWPDREMLRQTVLQFLPLSNILKVSDEELEFLTGTADQLLDIGPHRNARLGDQLNTVLGHRSYRRSIDDFGIDRHLYRFEYVAARQIDRRSHLEIEHNIGFLGRHQRMHHIGHVASGQIVGFELVGIEFQTGLRTLDHRRYDRRGRHLAPAHQDQLQQTDPHARHQCREPQAYGNEVKNKPNRKERNEDD